MRLRTFATLAPVSAALIFLFSNGSAIHAADSDKAGAIHVVCSNGLKHPFEQVSAQAEQAISHPLALQFGGALGLSDAIVSKNQAFDVAILTPVAIDDLAKAGKIIPGSRTVIARVGVAIAMRGDAPKPDVSTPEKFKSVMMAPTTKSIRWAGTGAVLPVVDAMIAKLGLEDLMKQKGHTSGPAATLEKGEIELRFDLNSEMLPGTMPARGEQYLGQFPGSVAGYIVMEGALSANSSDPKAAKALIDFLKGPALDPGLQAVGMVR